MHHGSSPAIMEQLPPILLHKEISKQKEKTQKVKGKKDSPVRQPKAHRAHSKDWQFW